jgi:hypothetical protein
MCAIAKFLLYSSSIFDIVMSNDKSTHLFVELLVYYHYKNSVVYDGRFPSRFIKISS